MKCGCFSGLFRGMMCAAEQQEGGWARTITCTPCCARKNGGAAAASLWLSSRCRQSPGATSVDAVVPSRPLLGLIALMICEDALATPQIGVHGWWRTCAPVARLGADAAKCAKQAFMPCFRCNRACPGALRPVTFAPPRLTWAPGWNLDCTNTNQDKNNALHANILTRAQCSSSKTVLQLRNSIYLPTVEVHSKRSPAAVTHQGYCITSLWLISFDC